MTLENKNLNVPPLRFPEFKGEWTCYEFGKIANNTCEKYNPCKNEHKEDIELDSLESDLGICTHFYDSSSQNSIKNVYTKNSILYGKLRPYLNKWYLPEKDGVCSSEIWVISSKVLERVFLYSLIQSKTFSDGANTSSGSKMPRADWDFVKKIRINVPEKSEQTKIGKLILSLERRIEVQRKIIEDLRIVKENIVNCFFDSEDCLLSTYLRETSNRLDNNDDYDVYSVSNSKGFNKQSEQFDGKTIASKDKSKYKVVKKLEFAYNPARINVGSIAINKLSHPLIVSPMYITFCTNKSINPFYLEYYFKSNSFKNQMKGFLEGSVRQCLQFSNLSKMMIKKTDLKQQEVFSRKMKKLDKLSNLETKALNCLNLLKSYLLKNMFI